MSVPRETGGGLFASLWRLPISVKLMLVGSVIMLPTMYLSYLLIPTRDYGYRQWTREIWVGVFFSIGPVFVASGFMLYLCGEVWKKVYRRNRDKAFRKLMGNYGDSAKPQQKD